MESDSDASFEFYCSDRDLCKNNPWVIADVSVAELKIPHKSHREPKSWESDVLQSSSESAPLE